MLVTADQQQRCTAISVNSNKPTYTITAPTFTQGMINNTETFTVVVAAHVSHFSLLFLLYLLDTWKWWQIFILLIIIIAVLVVYGLWKKCSKTSKCLTRVKEEKAVERVGGEEEEEAAHLRRPQMERDAEAAV